MRSGSHTNLHTSVRTQSYNFTTWRPHTVNEIPCSRRGWQWGDDSPDGASERKAGPLFTQLKWKGPPRALQAQRHPHLCPTPWADPGHTLHTSTHIQACVLNTLPSHTPVLHRHPAHTGRSLCLTHSSPHTGEGLPGSQTAHASRVTRMAHLMTRIRQMTVASTDRSDGPNQTVSVSCREGKQPNRLDQVWSPGKSRGGSSATFTPSGTHRSCQQPHRTQKQTPGPQGPGTLADTE